MNSQNIVDLIEQLSCLKSIGIKNFCASNLQSISNMPDCNLCFSLRNSIAEIEEHSEIISNEYNKLLKQTHKLIDLYYQLFQQEQRNYEQIILQLKRDFQESEEKVKQLQSVLSETKKANIHFTTLLLEKDQDLRMLEDKYEKQIRQKNNVVIFQQWQALKAHRREKSQMYTNLEKQNITLFMENQRYREENANLMEKINQLKQNLKRMEEDLVSNNIKSPKILNNIHDLGDFISNLGDRTFEDVENSIQRIQFSQQILHDDVLEQQSYLTSSFAHKPMPLREVLNISGQSSKYFELLSKQKILNSHAGRRKQPGSNNKLNENNLNSMNIINEDNVDIDKKMGQIKQFQVIDNETKLLTYQNLSTQTIQRNYVICGTQTTNSLSRAEQTQTTQCVYKNESVQTTEYSQCLNKKKSMLPLIDPYHAFFSLSIQCLKLNWRNLDEVANMDLSSQWQKLVEKKVPFNKWNSYLINEMQRRVVK